MIQELALGGPEPNVHFSGTAIELVRGILATAHVFLKDASLTERDLWKVYRSAYRDEPFVRIVKERQGVYRYPEPKILAGTNYCDVGFALDADTGRVVAISAIDNLTLTALYELKWWEIDPDARRLTLKVPHLVAAPTWSVEPGETFSAVWGTACFTNRPAMRAIDVAAFRM